MPEDRPSAATASSLKKARPSNGAAAAIPESLAFKLIASRSRRNAAIIAVSLILIGLGWWTHAGVKQSLREIRAAGLQTVLDAEIKALQLWIEEQKSHASRRAADPRVRRHVEELVRIGQSDPAALFNSSARRALVEVLEPVLKEEGNVAFNAIDRNGLIVATLHEEYSGLHIRPESFYPYISAVFEGNTKFVRPYPDEKRVVNPPQIVLAKPVIWIEAPVRNSGDEVIAALGFGKLAEEQFANILAVARPGRTGEAYAFDEHGVMLSESRFIGELPQIGLVPSEASAVFNVEVRDPGGDLRAGHQPEMELAARPLTRLAAIAIASRSKQSHERQRGVILDPYRNYRGAEVIGAWKWLPEYDMGVAIELEADEAYAPIHYLNIAFTLIFGALIFAIAAALLSSSSLVRLRRQVGDSRRVGSYWLKQQIGEGGMSKVYMARHELLKRPVVVKVLKHHLASDEFIARFEREVQLASQLSHPNTIEIYDFGRSREGAFYYAMEYLNGISLAELVAIEGKVGAARVVHILKQVCSALHAAHGKGLVHRDVKPENIMLCQRGADYDVVKVLDFGLVKNIEQPDTRDMTRYLRVLGTPAYMAPERLRTPGDVDARVDIYAVGAVGYLLLTGRKLFESASDCELTQMIFHVIPPPPSEFVAAIPKELDRLIVQCLAKNRDERPQNVSELSAILDALTTRYPWTQRDAAEWWRGEWQFVRDGMI